MLVIRSSFPNKSKESSEPVFHPAVTFKGTLKLLRSREIRRSKWIEAPARAWIAQPERVPRLLCEGSARTVK